MPKTLKFGSNDLEVGQLVVLLKKHACITYIPVTSPTPVFGRAIENMVLYFQMTHQDPDGKGLDVDGIVPHAASSDHTEGGGCEDGCDGKCDKELFRND